MTTESAGFSYEASDGTVLVEGSVDLNLDYQPEERDVGICGGWYTDGWDITEVSVTLCDEDGETVDQFEHKGKAAEAWLDTIRERNPELAQAVIDQIEKDCEDFCMSYAPEPDYDEDMYERRHGRRYYRRNWW